MRLNRDTTLLGLTVTITFGVIGLFIQGLVFSKKIGQKEEQLATNQRAIESLTKITTDLTKSTIELTKTVEFGAQTSRETRDTLRELQVRVRHLEIASGRQ